MVDIICFLCKPENLSSPAEALRSPVSVLLADDGSSLVRHIQPNARFVPYSLFITLFYFFHYYYYYLIFFMWLCLVLICFYFCG